MKKFFVLIFGSLIFPCLLTGCKAENVGAEIKLPIYAAEDVVYETATAEYMDISQTESMGAVIGYPYASYLTYPAQAQVTFADLVKNREVKQGDVLMTLDSSGLDYEINNQQSIVNSAYTASLSGGRAAQLRYDIEQCKLDLLLAQKDAYTIKAPFDGIITYTEPVFEGATVEEGGICCAISPQSKVRVYVEGKDAAKFRYGEKVRVKIDSDYYDAVVVSAPDVIPKTASRAVAQRAIFDLGEGVLDEIRQNDPLAITAGWATVYRTTEKKNVLAVPDEAVRTLGMTSSVTVVSEGERYRLNVTVGKSLGGYTEIINGISQGDVVMAEGVQR